MSPLTTTALGNLTLRPLTAGDLAAVLDLAAECPEWQWPREEFQECLSCPDAIGRVAEVDGRVIGFLVYRLDHGLREVFVKNLAVAPAWRRRGIGHALVKLLDDELTHGYERIRMLVPESGLGLQLLLRDCRFRAVRVLRDWFGDEHAYLMQKGQSV